MLINGRARTSYSIQASDDQVDWIEIARQSTSGKATIAVRVPSELVRRHFRAVPVGDN